MVMNVVELDFFWVLRSLNELNWVRLGLNWFYWVLMGFNVFFEGVSLSMAIFY